MKPRQIIGWLSLIILIWLGITAVAILSNFGHAEQSGQFGDSFGAVNALFTGLAFAGVIISLIFQQREIKIQQFESTFFHLMKRHNEISDNLVLGVKDSGGGRLLGMPVDFEHLYNDFRRHWEETETVRKLEKDSLRIQVAMHSFRQNEGANLGHYFRSLFVLFNHVDSSSISDSDKKRYAQIARAQLADHEQALLAYNCLSSFDDKKEFFRLVEKYLVIKHAFGLLLSERHMDMYPNHKRELEFSIP